MATRRDKGKPPALTAGGAKVEAFLAALDPAHRARIDGLRRAILAADPRIVEGIKWNAPSFRLDDDFATFHLRDPSRPQLVMHTGAKGKGLRLRGTVAEPAGLACDWRGDERCVLSFPADAPEAAIASALTAFVRDWIARL